MTWWHRLWRAKEMEEQLEKELGFHLEQYTTDLIARGQDPSEARRQARIDFGGPEQVKEDCRDARGTRWLLDLLQDLRYAARRLRANMGFAVVTVLTLAVGIGASTAIFGAVNPILFEPLPYPNAGRIAMIVETGKDGTRNPGTFGMYRGLLDRNRSFEAIAVIKPWQPTITGADQPERFDGQRVSASYFQVLGVSPILGRDFQTSADRLNGPKVVVLSDGLWQRRFGGDTAIVGRQITLDDDPYTVIGVMPRGFENVLEPSAEIWSPLQYDMSLGTAWGHHLRTVGRLLPGLVTAQASREIDALGHAVLTEQHPETYGRDVEFTVATLQTEVTRGVRPALLAILGAVLLVLLIACVNVTNLLLGRGAQRRAEFAMRAALGATRTRLVRQLLTESLLLAAIGGALGVVLAEFGVQALVALSPPDLPRTLAIGLNANVCVFAIGVTTAIGLMIGLIPALRASRELYTGMQQSSLRTGQGHGWTRRTLVVVEVALALVLLVSAGLLLRSLDHLFAVDPGFQPSNLLCIQVQTSGQRFDKDTTDRFFGQALDAVRRLPGVTMAGFTSQLPLSGDDDEYGARFEGDDPAAAYDVFRYAVSPGYFETVGLPLASGRVLDSRDVDGAPPAVMISQSLARLKFGTQDPVGRRLHIGPANGPWFTIVGVVGDVKQASLAVSQPEAVYMTTTQSLFGDNALWFVVRAHGDPRAIVPALKEAVWSVDKDQPIVRVATMDGLLAASAAQRRFALILFEAFGIVALVLAGIGIYGVLSGSVTERTRELGVRSALGGSRAGILILVIRQGMTLTGLGIVIGLGGAMAASHAIVAMLFGVTRLDPITYVSVIALLAGASAIACLAPGWRAARVDPAITLRAE
jgi:putative ABC transport system permease protein